MNKSQELPEEYQMVIHQARNNLVDFQIATNNKYIPNWHHEIIGNELQHIAEHGDRDYKILMIFEPPRHGKSQQATIDFPAWFLGKYPQKEIITASYSGELALDFGTKTREKVESEEYKYIFKTRLREDERSKGKWRTEEGGSYISVGVGGTITGRGADVLLIDDPIKNREESESLVYRNKIWEWFTSTAFTRLEPKGVVIVIVTRWHLDDLAGRILANNELRARTKVISFEAIAETDTEHRKKGEPLWQDKYNLQALQEIKSAIGPYDWAALYQQTPILTENQEFKPEWKKQITELELERMSVRKFLTIDTAISKASSSDFTGFCDNSVNQQNFWHIKGWRARMDGFELVDTIFSLYIKNRYERIGIEKTAYLDGLKFYIDEQQRKRNIFLPIVELKHNQTAKEIRIRGLIPRYASGSVFHIEGWCKDLEEEQMSFPFGAHDDVLDATAYQLQLVKQIMPQQWNYPQKPKTNPGL